MPSRRSSGPSGAGQLTPMQKRVLDLFGVVFRRYHQQRDPLLLDAEADIENQVPRDLEKCSQTIGDTA